MKNPTSTHLSITTPQLIAIQCANTVIARAQDVVARAKTKDPHITKPTNLEMLDMMETLILTFLRLQREGMAIDRKLYTEYMAKRKDIRDDGELNSDEPRRLRGTDYMIVHQLYTIGFRILVEESRLALIVSEKKQAIADTFVSYILEKAAAAMAGRPPTPRPGSNATIALTTVSSRIGVIKIIRDFHEKTFALANKAPSTPSSPIPPSSPQQALRASS